MRKHSIIRYMGDVFMIYGIATLLLNMFCMFFAEYTQEISTLFMLGSTRSGISTDTSLQFLLTVAAATGLKYIFMTDILIKNMSRTARTVALFISAFAVTCGSVALFAWFPVNDPFIWGLFIVCFFVSCAISTLASYIAEKQENDRLDAALKKYKEEN